MQTKFVPESSKIKNLENKEKTKPLLISNQLKVIDNAIFLNNQTLEVRELQLESLKNSGPSIVREYESISQNLKSLKRTYKSLSNRKFSTANSSKNSTMANNQNPEFSPNPIKPDLRGELINGLILCLGWRNNRLCKR